MAFLIDRRALLRAFSFFGLTPLLSKSAPAAPSTSNAFLQASQRLTGHTDLKPDLADRIAAAFTAQNADFPAKVAQLAALTEGGGTPEVHLAAATKAGLRTEALAIVSAWYTGTVGTGPYAPVVAYADALMFKAVADAVPVPTYCANGPAWWVAKPPALGIPVKREA